MGVIHSALIVARLFVFLVTTRPLAPLRSVFLIRPLSRAAGIARGGVADTRLELK